MLALRVLALAALLVLGAEGLDVASTEYRRLRHRHRAHGQFNKATINWGPGHILTFVKRLKHSHRETKPDVKAESAALNSTLAQGNLTSSAVTIAAVASTTATSTLPSPELLQGQIRQIWAHKAEMDELNDTIAAEKSLLEKQWALQLNNVHDSQVFNESVEEAKSIKAMIEKSQEAANLSRQEAARRAKKLLHDVDNERSLLVKEELEEHSMVAEATKKREAAEWKMKETAKAIQEAKEARDFFETRDTAPEAWLRKPPTVADIPTYWEMPNNEAQAAYEQLMPSTTTAKMQIVSSTAGSTTPSATIRAAPAAPSSFEDEAGTTGTKPPFLALSLSEEVSKESDHPSLVTHGSSDLDELASLAAGGFLDTSD